jgi:uncharacterized protein (UPF0276 family)
LLEWDDRIPPFDEVHREAKKAERYLAAARELQTVEVAQ